MKNSYRSNSYITTKVTVTDKAVKSLGKLYYALSVSDAKIPTFTAEFISGNTIKITKGTGTTYYLWIKAVDSLGNTTITKSKAFKFNGVTTTAKQPDVKIEVYQAVNEKRSGSVLKTVTNGDVKYTSWAKQQYMFAVTATSSDSTIKSIKWELTPGGKATEADANKSWPSTATTWAYSAKTVSKDLGVYDNGVRLGRITVTTAKGKSRIINIRANIDMQAPTISFSINGTKSGSSYKSGAKVTATCTDNLSGLVYMHTVDAQDKTDYRLFNEKTAVKSKGQTISLVTTGTKRNITTRCKDALGNGDVKPSPSYSIVR